MVILRPPWESQPPTGAVVRGRYANGLIFGFNGADNGAALIRQHRHPVTSLIVQSTDNAERTKQGPTGTGFSVRSGGSGFVRGSGSVILCSIPANSDWTFQAVIDAPSIASNGGFWRAGSTASGTTFFLNNGAGNRPWVRVAGSNVLVPASGPTWTNGNPLNILIRFKNSTSVDAWWDGAIKHTATHAIAQDAADIYILGQQSGTDYANGQWTGSRFWTRALSDAEMSELAVNPWALYEPRRIWVPVSAAAGAYTLTAAQGSYTLTGQATGLTAARTIAAGQGSYALTGQAAALLAGRLLAADQGAYTLTGQAAALSATRTLAADKGSYALTGQDAGLTAQRLLTCVHGTYALSGQGATLIYTPAGAYALAAGQGSYTLTGQDAGLTAARSFAATAGSYTLTGQDVSITRVTILTAELGSYVLAGQSATLSYSGAGAIPTYSDTLLAAARITQLRAEQRIQSLRFTQ